MTERGGRLIKGSLQRFALLCALLITLAVAIAFPLGEPIVWWWVETVDGPALQKEFGFTAERRRVLFAGDERSSTVITSVVSGGAFAQAGVLQGDTVACYYHGDSEFWSRLLAARDGHPSSITVVAADALAKGCGGARTLQVATTRGQ